MDYSLGCECGNRLSVTERSAGSVVSCLCGRAVAVPSLRELKGLDPGQVYFAPTVSSAGPPGLLAAPSEAAELERSRRLAAEQTLQAARDLEDLTAYTVVTRQAGYRNMLIGGLVCLAGVGYTAVTYSAAVSAGGGNYVVAWGAIVFGALQFFRGLNQYLT